MGNSLNQVRSQPDQLSDCPSARPRKIDKQRHANEKPFAGYEFEGISHFPFSKRKPQKIFLFQNKPSKANGQSQHTEVCADVSGLGTAKTSIKDHDITASHCFASELKKKKALWEKKERKKQR